MPALRYRNAVAAFKIEAAEGVAETLAGSDAVLVEAPRITTSPNIMTPDEVTGSLDDRGDLVGGMQVGIEFSIHLKHSGVAETPPEWGKLLKACGFAEVITATAVPVAAEACAAGGSTSTAVLGSSASSTAQIYRGMPVIFTGAVAGTAFISDYTAGKVATLTDLFGAAIVATTNYQIPKNVLYKPASSSIPSLTIGLYRDGVRWLFVGCRGTVTFELTTGGTFKANFRVTGMYSAYADVAVPTPTYDGTRPQIIKGAVALIDRVPAALRTLSLDVGNTLVYPDNPNASEGFDPSVITRRKMRGNMDPQRTAVATRDLFTAMRAGTSKIVHERFGPSAGNRMALTIPAALLTGNEDTDRDGIAVEGIPFNATGADAGAFLCCW